MTKITVEQLMEKMADLSLDEKELADFSLWMRSAPGLSTRN